MFKVIANVGAWDTIFTAATTSEDVRRYMPPRADSRGRDGPVLVLELAAQQDPQTQRPNMVLLVAESRDPVAALACRVAIAQDASSELQRVVTANGVSAVRVEISRIRAACERVALAFPPAASRGRERASLSFWPAVFLTVLGVAALASAFVVLRDFRLHTEAIARISGNGDGSISALLQRKKDLDKHVQDLDTAVENLKSKADRLDRAASDCRDSLERILADEKRARGIVDGDTGNPGLLVDAQRILKSLRGDGQLAGLVRQVELIEAGTGHEDGLRQLSDRVASIRGELGSATDVQSPEGRLKRMREGIDSLERALEESSAAKLVERLKDAKSKIESLEREAASGEGRVTIFENRFPDKDAEVNLTLPVTVTPNTQQLSMTFERKLESSDNDPGLEVLYVDLLGADGKTIETHWKGWPPNGLVPLPPSMHPGAYRAIAVRVHVKSSSSKGMLEAAGRGARALITAREIK